MAFLTFLSIQIKLGFLASVQKGFSELECLLRDVSVDFGVEVNSETQPWASQSGCTLKDFCSFGSYNHGLSEGSSFLFSLINEIIEWFLRVP